MNDHINTTRVSDTKINQRDLTLLIESKQTSEIYQYIERSIIGGNISYEHYTNDQVSALDDHKYIRQMLLSEHTAWM